MHRALLVAAALCVYSIASADPLRFQQQGRLLDELGAPVDGTRDLVVRLYADETGGTALWERTWPGTPVQDGYFAVTLTGADDHGVTLESALPGGVARWLTTDVGSGELSPRQPIATVPEAARARGVPLVSEAAACDLLGGLGYDASTGSLVVCTGTSWSRVGSAACPSGTLAIGATCIDASPRASVTYDVAVSTCVAAGRRLCSSNELLYACMNRGALGFTMEDATWYFHDQRDRVMWTYNGSTNLRYPAHHVYRRMGNKCFDNTDVENPTNVTTSFAHGTTEYSHYCCLER